MNAKIVTSDKQTKAKGNVMYLNLKLGLDSAVGVILAESLPSNCPCSAGASSRHFLVKKVKVHASPRGWGAVVRNVKCIIYIIFIYIDTRFASRI